MRKMIAFLAAAAACLSLAACSGSKPAASGTGKQPAAADVVAAVSGQLTFQDTMMTLESEMVSNIYSLKEDKLEDLCVSVSGSGATAEEVSVFKVKDEADIGMVTAAIDERIEDQKLSYQNYMPAEMVKIENAAVCTNGKYVILVMADDVSKVEETFNAQF